MSVHLADEDEMVEVRFPFDPGDRPVDAWRVIDGLVARSLEDHEALGLPRALNPYATHLPDRVTIGGPESPFWARLDRDRVQFGARPPHQQE